MKNLLLALKNVGISQRQAANDLQIDHSLFNRYVLEKVEPSVNMALKIAEYLDVSIDYLVGRESKGKSESGKIDKKILSDIEISLKDLQISLGELKSTIYDDCTSVPLLEDTIAAGNPVPISGQSSESRFFIQSWLKKFHQPLLITVGKG